MERVLMAAAGCSALAENAVARAVDLTAEKYCPLAIMLGKGVEISHSDEVNELS